MKSYDFVAIGGGNAGFAALHQVADAGLGAALIDRGAIGGLCSLNGCNPKKVLVRSAEVLDEVRHAAKFGVTTGEVSIDWRKVIERKEGFTRPVTQQSEEILKSRGIDHIVGAPRFVAPNAVEVDGERIEARGFLIATGSTPRPLKMKGAELVRTSDDILALREIPERLVIIGAGVIAIEFGQVFARAGSRVTIVTPGKTLLSNEDQDAVAALMNFSQERLGIEFVFQARGLEIRRDGETLIYETEIDKNRRAFEADFILNAAGRVPSLDDLDLERGEIECDRRGVVVNEYLRSVSNPSVFAAGDAHGKLQLSPVATYEGRLAGKNYLEGDMHAARYDDIARAVYTVPQLASVGLTEAEARQRGLDVIVHAHDMKNWKVYAIAGEEAAYAKVIADRESGHIVGAHLYGHAAGEIIHIFAMAMRYGATAEALRDMVYAYPTFSSALPSVFQ